MPVKIKIVMKDIVLDAELFDTATAKAVAATLPVEVNPNEWEMSFILKSRSGCLWDPVESYKLDRNTD